MRFPVAISIDSEDLLLTFVVCILSDRESLSLLYDYQIIRSECTSLLLLVNNCNAIITVFQKFSSGTFNFYV